MDLKKVTKTDLSASNLSRLEQELTDMASKGNAKAFKTLIKFMERIAEINQNAKLTVSKTDGSKNLKINDTETINYAETLGKIKDAIEAGFTTTPTGKAADRKKQLEEAIETTIGTMLNEDSIMNQLIRNGLDEKEYQDFMEKEKENSKAKYEEAKAKYEELAKKQEDIFGKEERESPFL